MTPRHQTAPTRCLIALSHLLLCHGCHELFDEDSTGHALLARCAEVTLVASESAATGSATPPHIELPGCVAAADRNTDAAFNGHEKCERCPEACALVLLLQAAVHELEDVAGCSYSLLLYMRARAHFQEFEPHWTQALLWNLPALVNARRGQCAGLRRKELLHVKLPAAQPLASEKGRVPARVAVLLAATPSMLQVYQPFINLWRCYALRHDLAFVLETDAAEVMPPHHRAPNWLRWFAARRFLPFYSALLIVDPDQVIVPECWNLSIPALAAGADVGTRDFGKPQTLNNGVVLLRNSPRGRFFLEQLLRKAAWAQTIEKDQGPFDETVLELLGLEVKASGGEGYDSECAQWLFANVDGNHQVAHYALCWWRVSEQLAGPFGARRSHTMHFVDPRVADINHVVGARGLEDPALLYHFAGRSKDWELMLSTFGISRRHTADCGKVFAHVERMGEEKACKPGGPVVEECEPPEVVC